MTRLGCPGERLAVCQGNSEHGITVKNPPQSSGVRKFFLSIWRELPLLRRSHVNQAYGDDV